MNNWIAISEMYDKAKENLWCTNEPSWRRNEDEGLYYMWQAYHMAINEAEKDDLYFARILVMMNQENHIESNYERFNKYISPAHSAYMRAIECGKQVSENEISRIEFLYNALAYVVKRTEDSPEELENALTYISGIENVQNFQFHDSKIIHFEHDEDSAVLIFEFEGIVVPIKFYDVYELQVNCDPKTSYVTDYYCYPQFSNSSRYIFDVGFYRIDCKRIEVLKEWGN